MIGICDSPGIFQVGSGGALLKPAAFGCITWLYRKLVRPSTSRFSTTPSTTWSTR